VPVAAASALLAAALAVSSALPAAAEDRRLEAQAEAEAAGTDVEALKDAAQKAELARRLNPLDEQALFVAADLQVRLGQIGKAQELLFEAARVQPDNYRVWDRLVEAENALGDYRLASIAVQKRIEAEPLSFAEDPEKSAGFLFISEVPSQLSPTAFGTPP
jgi:tetratricopeptide (TPR) repeat protein